MDKSPSSSPSSFAVPSDPQEALVQGQSLTSEGKSAAAIACFLFAFRNGSRDVRRQAVLELEKLGEIETFGDEASVRARHDDVLKKQQIPPLPIIEEPARVTQGAKAKVAKPNPGLIAVAVSTILCLACLGCLGIWVIATVVESIAAAPAHATATAQSVQATATAQVPRATATAASQWRVVLTDSFDANLNGWRTGEVTDEFGTFSWLLGDGKYRWTAKAVKGVVWREWPRIASVSDFYLTVEGQRIRGPKSGRYGVIFRNESSNYYLCTINDNQFFKCDLRYQGQWFDLINTRFSSYIRPDVVNKITVIAQGSHFVFFINDQYVGEADDSHVSQGRPGVAIDLDAGDEAVFEFDNFEVRAP